MFKNTNPSQRKAIFMNNDINREKVSAKPCLCINIVFTSRLIGSEASSCKVTGHELWLEIRIYIMIGTMTMIIFNAGNNSVSNVTRLFAHLYLLV